MSSDKGSSLLDLQGIRRSFTASGTVEVLRSIDLSIRAGEIATIVGRSGSGKSTLLNIIGLLDRPTAGLYRVAGVDTAKVPAADLDRLRARTFGFVFQNYLLVDELSVLENVAMGLYARRVRSIKNARIVAAELVAQLGMADLMEAEASTLSGGERQRVAIARALVGAPQVLVCDEPTGSLDSRTEADVMELLVEANRRGVTLLIATHNPDIAEFGNVRIEIADGTARLE